MFPGLLLSTESDFFLSFLAGHFVPSKTSWRKFLAEYIKNPSTEISPGAFSGTATPVGGRDTPVIRESAVNSTRADDGTAESSVASRRAPTMKL